MPARSTRTAGAKSALRGGCSGLAGGVGGATLGCCGAAAPPPAWRGRHKGVEHGALGALRVCLGQERLALGLGVDRAGRSQGGARRSALLGALVVRSTLRILCVCGPCQQSGTLLTLLGMHRHYTSTVVSVAQ